MTHRTGLRLFLGAATVLSTACGEGPTAASDLATQAALAAALNSSPVGYGDLSSSYVGSTASGFSQGAFFLGGGQSASFNRSSMMGGDMSADFLGTIAFGSGSGHRGPFGGGLSCTGTFNAATGRVECPVETHNGLTITRSAAYLTAAGAVQQAFDTITTNSVNMQSRVAGTVTYDTTSNGRGPDGHHGWGMDRGPGGKLLGDTTTILSATTTVASTSTRTTTGLAKASTARTVNGTSGGTESTTGRSSRGAFTSTRVVGDTTKNVVVPVSTAAVSISYPTAGTVIREMKATLTYAGAAPATVSRREVLTYNGSATATVVITENGVAKTCTRALPFGRLVCP